MAYKWKTIGIVGCCLGGVIGPQSSQKGKLRGKGVAHYSLGQRLVKRVVIEGDGFVSVEEDGGVWPEKVD